MIILGIALHGFVMGARISGYFGSLRDPQLYRYFCRAETVQHRHIGRPVMQIGGIMTEVLYYVAMALISIGGMR